MLIDFLNEYYQADLETIHDVAGNMHLTGHSERFLCDLFVKIFKDKAKFYAEQHVNQVYCPDIYLDNVIYEDNYVIVLKDRVMNDVEKEDLTPTKVYQFGEKLALFHASLTGKVSVPNDKRALSQRLEEQVAKFTGTAYETEVNEVFSRLEEDLAPADTDYELLPKVVLHGDFSIRNLMLYGEHEVLIDFERAHMGVAYEDLIKFFFNEVNELDLRNEFIAGYRSQKELEIPNYSLQHCLLFLCALDILEFHLTHEKQKFGQMAHEMFETIKQGTAVLEL